MSETEEAELGTPKFYVVGFILSILLTLAAYFIVTKHLLTGSKLVAAIIGLGTVQAVVQFICFLQLSRESKPRWNLIVFLFMVVIVAVLVVGSLWIMYNLDYRMMAPGDVGFG